jgi:carboxyl-terminal processing protease
MSSRRLTYVLALIFAFALGATTSRGLDIYEAHAAAERPDLGLFWQAWDLAQKEFVYRDGLQTEKMVYGAIRGMVDALGDDGHTRFLTPDEVRTERSSIRGQFDGIGAEVNLRGGRPVVIAPIEDSPAERAGLLAGDTIVMVDGDDVSTLTLTELVNRVRGPRGSVVKLTVIHPGESTTAELEITRAEVTVRPVTWALVPGTTIGHLRVNRFGPTTSKELIAAIGQLREEGADRLVLDLRNNPGGLLHEAVATTSQFLKDGNVLLEENAKGERKPFAVAPGGVALDLPIAVLINRGSASAAEIMAGAIQDQKRGPIVGERSFGTGTVLTPFNLDDGSQIYLGTSQWLTPEGRVIRKAGIQPDVAVPMPAGARPISPREQRVLPAEVLAERNDAQLKRAIELLTAG